MKMSHNTHELRNEVVEELISEPVSANRETIPEEGNLMSFLSVPHV